MSATAMRPAALCTVTEPPRGVSRSAFSIRFEATCSTRSWSASTQASSPSAERTTPKSRAGGLVARDRLARDLREVDGLVRDRELVPVHPREVEQVADEPLEPPRLEEDRPRSLVGAERALAEALGVAADRGERRLQLVADREQEVALALARGRELRRHLVEGLRQRRELARALLRQRRRRLAGGEGVARLGDAAHGPHDRAGDDERRARRRRPRRRAPPAAGRRGTGATPPSARSPASAAAARAPGSCGRSRGTSCRRRSSSRRSSGRRPARMARGAAAGPTIVVTPPDSSFETR